MSSTDDRCELIRFSARRSQLRRIYPDTALGIRVRKHLDAEVSLMRPEQVAILADSSGRYMDLADVDRFQSAVMAYTLHVQANWRPV